MKIEFPFVATVLATGCLLWAVLGFRSETMTGVDPETTLHKGLVGETINRLEPSSPGLTEADGVGEVPAEQLLRQAAASLFDSVPIQAAARMRVNLFDQQIVSEGRYLQLGQGSGRARLEFVLEDGSRPRTILQICDGRFFYLYDSLKSEPRLQVADLSKFAQSDQQLLLADATTWMATGGLSSLLENLANNFDFEAVTGSHVGETPVLVCQGRWKPDRLRRLLMGQINHALIQEKIQWDRLPAQIPHSVEIILGNDSFFPLFPYRLSFFRTQHSPGKTENANIATMELYELTRNAVLAEEMFIVESGVPPEDLTRDFVERIQNLNQVIRSASDADSNQHR